MTEDHFDDSTDGSDLRSRLDAARERTARLTRASTEAAREVVEAHPFAAVAGGILLGVLVGKALSGRRSAPTTANSLGKRASALATLGAELATAYLARAADAGRESAGKLEDVGQSLGGKLANGTDDMKKRAFDFAEAATAVAKDAADVALRRANEFASRIRH